MIRLVHGEGHVMQTVSAIVTPAILAISVLDVKMDIIGMEKPVQAGRDFLLFYGNNSIRVSFLCSEIFSF